MPNRKSSKFELKVRVNIQLDLGLLLMLYLISQRVLA
jgi:hypothetical protein